MLPLHVQSLAVGNLVLPCDADWAHPETNQTLDGVRIARSGPILANLMGGDGTKRNEGRTNEKKNPP